MGALGQVKAAASKMISLTRKAKEPLPTTQSTSTLDSVHEGGRNGEAQGDLGAFGADDIQALLRRMNYRVRGIVGTTGYTAPEVVRDGLYSAIRADLWSCGKTVEELCLLCRPSIDRDVLLEISKQLMDEDPEKRPTMSDVLDRLARCTVDATTK